MHVLCGKADVNLTNSSGELTEDRVGHVITIMHNLEKTGVKNGKVQPGQANGLDNKPCEPGLTEDSGP